MLVQIAFSLICLALGASGGYAAGLFKIGWWLGDDSDSVKARESLKNLEDLTTRVSGQVQEHARRVETAQLSLDEAGAYEDGGPAAVAQAAEALRAANEQLQAELRKAKRDLERQQSELQCHRREARTDGLTQLLNRRAFDEEIARLSECRAETGLEPALLMLDIDHFKKFNDTYGHQVGDRVLRHVADVIRQSLAGLDVTAARYGGEEFALILANGERSFATRTAETLRTAVAAAGLDHQGQMLAITLSMGVCQLSSGLDAEQLVARADAALYAAKRAGRNRGYLHNGQECVPLVEPEAEPDVKPATESKGAELAEPEPEIEQALADLAASLEQATASALAPTRERRQAERRVYLRRHMVGPIIDGRLPTKEEFVEAQFIDLSSTGFGMLLDAPPTYKNFVVTLDKADGTVYALADVVRLRRRPLSDPSGGGWEVGCRFMGKLQALNEPAVLT